MKIVKILKDYILYLIIAVLLIVLICLYISNKKQKYELLSYKTEKVKIEKEIQTEAKIIKRKVDEKGAETVLFDIHNNVVRAGMKPTEIPAKTKGLIDTTAMALDIRTNQLKQILAVNATLADENLKLKKELDANQRPYYTYRSKELNLKFTPPTETDTSAYADFSANVDIKATQYWRKKWFLGTKRPILAISSPDPRFKINGADFLEIDERGNVISRFQVQGEANYDIKSRQLGIGPAARINIGRTTLYGNYLFYPDGFRPSVGLTVDVVRF